MKYFAIAIGRSKMNMQKIENIAKGFYGCVDRNLNDTSRNYSKIAKQIWEISKKQLL
jgi:hypothetical protein